MGWWKYCWLYLSIYCLVVIKLVVETKIVAAAATNAPGVLGGVQESPGGPSEGPRKCLVANVGTYLDIRIHNPRRGQRDKNRCRGCYKRPGGPRGGLRGSQIAHTALLMRRFGSCSILMLHDPNCRITTMQRPLYLWSVEKWQLSICSCRTGFFSSYLFFLKLAHVGK